MTDIYSCVQGMNVYRTKMLKIECQAVTQCKFITRVTTEGQSCINVPWQLFLKAMFFFSTPDGFLTYCEKCSS